MTKSLRELAYYRTGGSCEVLYEPTSIDELAAAMRAIHSKKQAFFFLGGGTNSLVMDEFWPGAVVSFSKMQGVRADGLQVYVEAGVDNSKLAEFCATKSLGGVAWMNGLPGQLGGTVRMNARCYGGEISQVVSEVVSVDAQGMIHRRPSQGLFRGYKDTEFMDNGEAIAAVTLSLQKGDPDEIRRLMNHCQTDREGKGQFIHPTCGCVFKNDYSIGVPSGMLLEAAGAKTLQLENLEVNPHHANFLYNKGASSRQILEATFAMRKLVLDRFGCWLEYEMEILGDPPADLKDKLNNPPETQRNEKALTPLRETFQASLGQRSPKKG